MSWRGRESALLSEIRDQRERARRARARLLRLLRHLRDHLVDVERGRDVRVPEREVLVHDPLERRAPHAAARVVVRAARRLLPRERLLVVQQRRADDAHQRLEHLRADGRAERETAAEDPRANRARRARARSRTWSRGSRYASVRCSNVVESE